MATSRTRRRAATIPMPSDVGDGIAAGRKLGLERIGPFSLSRRTHQALRDAIRCGEFPDGKLPAENDLAAALGVSRTTLRAALQALEQDGILSRRRGIGTRIVRRDEGPFQLELNRLAALDDLLRERGHESSTRIVGIERERLPGLAAEFGIAVDSEWHVIDKVWYADGRPAAMLRDHIPCDVLPELPDNSDLVGTIFWLFAEVGPEPIALARVELMPRAADTEVAKQLHIKRGEPYLRLWQRHYGARENPLAASRLDINDHFIRLEIVRRL